MNTMYYKIALYLFFSRSYLIIKKNDPQKTDKNSIKPTI